MVVINARMELGPPMALPVLQFHAPLSATLAMLAHVDAGMDIVVVLVT